MEAAIFFTKSEENLTAAQLCLQNGLFNASANRAYYAMFQAAVAILLTRGITFDPKQHLDHALIRSLFSNEFIHRKKVFQRKYASSLYDALALRILADYQTTTISARKARQLLLRAEEFIHIIKAEFGHA